MDADLCKEAFDKPQIVERVHAINVDCDLGLAGKYNIESVPPVMAHDEFIYCNTKTLFYGEAECIREITPNILIKIKSIERLSLGGHYIYNKCYNLTKKFFDAFAENGVSLRLLQSLKVFACVLDLSIEDFDDILKDCSLSEFHYTQHKHKAYLGTPITFLSDKFLSTITESLRIIADCESFCWDVTDATLNKWKLHLPHMIWLQNCHTSFSLKCVWELVQIAKEHTRPVDWNFGYIEPNDNNQNTLLRIQKEIGFCWEKSDDQTYRMSGSTEGDTSVRPAPLFNSCTLGA